MKLKEKNKNINKSRKIYKGGARVTRSRAVINRKKLSCFEKYINIIGNLIESKDKLDRIRNIINNALNRTRGTALPNDNQLLNTNDWSELIAKEDRRTADISVVIPSKLKKELAGEMPGIIDLAEEEKFSFIDAADILYSNLKDKLENGDKDEQTVAARTLSTFFVNRIKGTGDFHLFGSLLDEMDDISAPDISERAIEAATPEYIMLFPNGFGDTTLPEIINIKREWTSEDSINLLGERYLYNSRGRLWGPRVDVNNRLLSSFGYDCAKTSNDDDENRLERMNAFNKLINIYDRAFVELIPYLPDGFFIKELLEFKDIPRDQAPAYNIANDNRFRVPQLPAADIIIDPAALDPAALDPAALDPAALDPAALDPAALDPAALVPAAFDPAAFDPAASLYSIAEGEKQKKIKKMKLIKRKTKKKDKEKTKTKTKTKTIFSYLFK